MEDTIHPSQLSDDNQKLDIESVRALVAVINSHMHGLLEDTESQMALKYKCISKFKIQSQEYFEFSEHSVLSNLYWGIDCIEEATQAKCVEERDKRLENAEKMLQVPASLDENGTTLGILNSYLICCSYFYLCIVEGLRKNEWQVAIHFLEALFVSPNLVYKEFVPGIFQSFFPFIVRHKLHISLRCDYDDGMIDDVMRWMARRYKPWLMYYKIMSVGGFHQGNGDDDHSQHILKGYQKTRSIESQKSFENKTEIRTYPSHETMNPPDFGENISNEEEGALCKFQSHGCKTQTSSIKCLKDILSESDPDTPTFLQSCNSSFTEKVFPEDYLEHSSTSFTNGRLPAEDQKAEFLNKHGSLSSWNPQAPLSRFKPQKKVSTLQLNEIQITECFPRSFSASFCDTHISGLGLVNIDRCTSLIDRIDEEELTLRKHHFNGSTLSLDQQKNCKKIVKKSSSTRTTTLPDPNPHLEENLETGLVENMISNLCFGEEIGSGEEDLKRIYEILSTKSGLKYSLLKDIILDQLLKAITTSKEPRVVRASLSILSTIVTANRSVLDDIKRKGLQLYDLATALKQNVHEAVILIYLINPSPTEIKRLELLPCLVEVVCASRNNKVGLTSLFLTPPSASLMIIEVLVTAFDYETNSMHLAAISSPRVLSGLLQVPRKDNLEEFISLAAILVNCMRFDGSCRKYIAEISPISPFVSLLWSNRTRATNIALEFFNELLRMPRSSAIVLSEQIQKEGSINNMCALFLLTQNSEPEYKLLAANLLLQLEVLEDMSAKCIYREEAAEAILESLANEEETQSTQALSAFILSNIGGTFSWTGEPYTTAWLLKKTGLSSLQHKNVIKTYDFSDQCLQDSGTDAWCSKISRRILHLGTPVFHALDKGLNSKLKRVSRDSLTAAAWLGCELVKGPEELRQAACEIILHSIQQYVHPVWELEERLLACLCIYNYTSGRGMKKLMNLSEGVRESLRRLSNVSWMAEELLKVADYFQPNKWRISCVHSQILEAGSKTNGAVTALIYYKGKLLGGYADGSIKVWEIKGQTATLVQEVKDHKKAVTCFALYETGNCLLSGSADKTIKMWQMLQRNLECIEVISTKEPIRSIDSWAELIYVTTQSYKLKVIDASRKAKDIFKNKRVKCLEVTQGKVYAGCTDSSIQELLISSNRQQEIKAPSKSWMSVKPITSVAIYKEWLYSANSVVEGSKLKDWRKGSKPQVSIVPEKGATILGMEVVEDFVYLNCSTSMSSLQIWLRGTQHKVGRLSAGSKITSIISANDMILCGTERGTIKGWIPL